MLEPKPMLVDFGDGMKLAEEPKPILVDLSDKEQSWMAWTFYSNTGRLHILDGLDTDGLVVWTASIWTDLLFEQPRLDVLDDLEMDGLVAGTSWTASICPGRPRYGSSSSFIQLNDRPVSSVHFIMGRSNNRELRKYTLGDRAGTEEFNDDRIASECSQRVHLNIPQV